ncbi:MAG: hypothetical protein OXH57_08220 [Ekhidna sp.]|nr:hypothetical protein [Ekhidna sp.]
MLTGIVPKPRDEVNILNLIIMFFITTKSKRKNVIVALGLTLLMAGGVSLESKLSEQSKFDCMDQINNQKDAGWFFGCHKNEKKNRWERRFLGFRVGDCCGC